PTRVAEVRAPANDRIREFVVGDRVQVAVGWSNYPRGLIGTIAHTPNEPTLVNIRFDIPQTTVVSSRTNYINLVDFDRQPDVPRERAIAPPAPAPAVVADQRHQIGDIPLPAPVAAPVPVAPVHLFPALPGAIEVGDRV